MRKFRNLIKLLFLILIIFSSNISMSSLGNGININDYINRIGPQISPYRYLDITQLEAGWHLREGNNYIEVPELLVRKKIKFNDFLNPAVKKNLDYVEFSFPANDSDLEGLNKELYYLSKKKIKTSLSGSGEEIDKSRAIIYPVMNIKMKKPATLKFSLKESKEDKKYFIYDGTKGLNYLNLPSAGFVGMNYIIFLGDSAKYVDAIYDGDRAWKVPKDWKYQLFKGEFNSDDVIENRQIWIDFKKDRALKKEWPINSFSIGSGSGTLDNWEDLASLISGLKINKSDIKIEGESDKFNLNQKVIDFTKKVDSSNLPFLGGTLETDKGKYAYTEGVELNGLGESGKWVYDIDKYSGVAGNYLKFNSKDRLFDYHLKFDKPLVSGVDRNGRINGMYGKIIEILGREYLIYKAVRNKKGEVEITLLGSDYGKPFRIKLTDNPLDSLYSKSVEVNGANRGFGNVRINATYGQDIITLNSIDYFVTLNSLPEIYLRPGVFPREFSDEADYGMGYLTSEVDDKYNAPDLLLYTLGIDYVFDFESIKNSYSEGASASIVYDVSEFSGDGEPLTSLTFYFDGAIYDPHIDEHLDNRFIQDPEKNLILKEGIHDFINISRNLFNINIGDTFLLNPQNSSDKNIFLKYNGISTLSIGGVSISAVKLRVMNGTKSYAYEPFYSSNGSFEMNFEGNKFKGYVDIGGNYSLAIDLNGDGIIEGYDSKFKINEGSEIHLWDGMLNGKEQIEFLATIPSSYLESGNSERFNIYTSANGSDIKVGVGDTLALLKDSVEDGIRLSSFTEYGCYVQNSEIVEKDRLGVFKTYDTSIQCPRTQAYADVYITFNY